MADLFNKLSLVAQFDDLVRNRAVLTAGIESDFLEFVVNQDVCRQHWLESDSRYSKLNEANKALKQEKNTLETQLKHARNQIDHEIKKRKRAEQDRDQLERQIMLVRELLLTDKNHSMLNERDRERLAFLSTDFAGRSHGLDTIDESVSLVSPSDISYDKTEEDLDTSYLRSGRKWKRPSAPPASTDDELAASPVLRKQSRHSSTRRKHRRSRSAVVAKTTVTMGAGKVEAETEVMNDGRKRHLSAATPNKNMKKFHSDGSVHPNSSTPENCFKTPPNSQQTLRHFGSGNTLNKPHIFVSKTIIKPESCNPCGKRIRFGKVAMKCKDCRATAHPECKENVPKPCVPVTPMTPNNNKVISGIISDFTSSDVPMIPALVIHCVNEVEARGLTEVGIYRVPGSEREVKELKEKFLRGRGVPHLSNVTDINVVCSCLKDFLRQLKEPLVTYNLWQRFVNAAEAVDGEESVSSTYQAISELPQANRDTLAFLILHLIRVSESSECKMNVSNIAKVFGPSVVGFSAPDPEPMQMITETRKQQTVMERLLSISADYWTCYINVDEVPYPRDTPQTPEVPHSMLGPVDMDVTTDKKTWFTPRFGSKSRHSSKRTTNYFASPMLK